MVKINHFLKWKRKHSLIGGGTPYRWWQFLYNNKPSRHLHGDQARRALSKVINRKWDSGHCQREAELWCLLRTQQPCLWRAGWPGLVSILRKWPWACRSTALGWWQCSAQEPVYIPSPLVGAAGLRRLTHWHRHREQTCGCQGGRGDGGGMEWEFGVSRWKLVYIE